jgi:predicted DCC family thiol-disulfide oxidoreductase YuxK
MTITSVMLGIATYRRPGDLARLLESLRPEIEAVGAAVPGVAVDVFVVDNDAAGSARDVVRAAPFPVTYSVEHTPGIAAARNHAMAIFDRGEHDALVFVDDDEYVPAGWLTELLRYAGSTDADVVSGPVVTVFSPDTPRWVLRGGFLQRTRFPSGTRYWTAATNNTLLRYASWRAAGSPRFDGSFSSTGGSDTDFFSRLTEAGATIEFCDSAPVFEDAPADRLTPRWIVRRGLRVGVVQGRVLRRRNGVGAVVALICRCLGVGTVGLVVDALRGAGVRQKNANRLLHGAGLLSSLVGYRVHEYQRPREADPASAGTLVYDADCGFCTRSASWLSAGGRVSVTSWQSLPDLASRGLTVEMVAEAAYWLRPGSEPLAGSAAIAAALVVRGPWPLRIAGRLFDARPVAPLAAAVYRLVARNRYRMPGGTAACRIDQRSAA